MVEKLEGFFTVSAPVQSEHEAIATIDEMVQKYRRPGQSGKNCAIEPENDAHLVLVPRPVPYSLGADIARYLNVSLKKAKWPDSPKHASIYVKKLSGDAAALLDEINKSFPDGVTMNGHAVPAGDGLEIHCQRGQGGYHIDTVLGFLDRCGINYTAKLS